MRSGGPLIARLVSLLAKHRTRYPSKCYLPLSVFWHELSFQLAIKAYAMYPQGSFRDVWCFKGKINQSLKPFSDEINRYGDEHIMLAEKHRIDHASCLITLLLVYLVRGLWVKRISKKTKRKNMLSIFASCFGTKVYQKCPRLVHANVRFIIYVDL